MAYALFLHILSAVVWVGGMFVAYMAVRPAAGEVLTEPPLRLKLWTAIFTRFFKWVWVAVALILGSGFYMMGQMGAMPGHIMVMATIGVAMSAIFMHVYFAPFGRLKRAVAAEDWKTGGAALNQIRMLIAVNLILGLVNVAVAVLGAGGVF
ncbi:MAG TPA: CopD family protein [Burkholderiales bacterium]|nr:CopD family protein [Burkholderiales bacterium]